MNYKKDTIIFRIDKELKKKFVKDLKENGQTITGYLTIKILEKVKK